MDETGDNKIYLSSSLFGNNKKPQITLSAAIGPVRLQKIKGDIFIEYYLNKNFCNNNQFLTIAFSYVVGKSTISDKRYENDRKSYGGGGTLWSVSKEKTFESIRSMHNSRTHSKKGIKHALRQQAKRRRKNTTIAAGNTVPIPRYISPSLDGNAQRETN